MKLTEVSRDEAKISTFFENISCVEQPNIFIGHYSFHYNDPDHKEFIKFKNECKQINLYGSRVNIAINSKLIKFDIHNLNIRIRKYNKDEVDQAINSGNLFHVDDYSNFVDSQTIHNYIENDRRIIEINMKIAIESTTDIVGGGLSYVD